MLRRHRWDLWQRLGGNVLIESLCPVLVVGLVVDCLGRVAWAVYSGRDVQIYAAVARLWADGYLPYRDVYDFKPPLIYAALRVGFACWGYHAESLRHVLMLLTGFGALSLYAGLRRGGHAIAAPVAAMAFLSLIVPNTWALAFQNTEMLVAGFTAAAIGCAAAHQRAARWWWAFATGACAALAVLGKQPGILFVLPLLVHLCLWGSRTGWRHRVRHVAGRSLLFAAGFASIIGLTAIYFAWHGALIVMYQAVLVDGGRYAQVTWSTLLTPSGWSYLAQRPAGRLIAAWLIGQPENTVLGQVFMLWCFIGPLYLLVPATILWPSRLTLVAWVWVPTAYLGIVAGPSDFDHYTILAYPALALIAGVAVEAVFSRWSLRDGAAKTPWVAVGLIVAVLLFGNRWLVSYVPRRHLDLSAEPADPGQAIGERIRAVAQPGDTLLLEGEPYTTYLYSGVPPPTRFIYWNAPNPDAGREREESLRRLPSFIVFKAHTYEQLRDRAAAVADQRYALTADVLRDYTELFANPDAVVLYRRASVP